MPPKKATFVKDVPRRTMDGERLLAVLSQLVEPLGRSLPVSSEVVLHDLSQLPNSIVAVCGDVTGRLPGDPATDLLLQQAAQGFTQGSIVGYDTRLPDGRQLRSSTMIIRDISGEPVAAVCVNTDISAWRSIQNIASSMLNSQQLAAQAAPDQTILEFAGDDAGNASTQADHGASQELFVRDVDELASHLIRSAIEAEGVPVKFMKKRNKVRVVHELRDRGLFTIRNAVDFCASALGVTRFTVYNYLNSPVDSEE